MEKSISPEEILLIREIRILQNKYYKILPSFDTFNASIEKLKCYISICKQIIIEHETEIKRKSMIFMSGLIIDKISEKDIKKGETLKECIGLMSEIYSTKNILDPIMEITNEQSNKAKELLEKLAIK